MPAPLRPHSLDEALTLLARPLLVQLTAGGPPLRPHPHALIMDTGRVLDMAGIRLAANTIFVGANTRYEVIQRSQLLKQRAACLTDVCRRLESAAPGGALLHDFAEKDVSHDLVLALEILDARIEIAERDEQGAISKTLQPLHTFFHDQSERPRIPLGVHFPAPAVFTGSALYCEDDLGVLQPDVQCAAVIVSISEKTGLIEAARLYFATPGLWPFACAQAATALIGLAPQKEAIEAVVRLAQRICPQPRASSPPYGVTLSSHLARVTLDRAFARIRATPPL